MKHPCIYNDNENKKISRVKIFSLIALKQKKVVWNSISRSFIKIMTFNIYSKERLNKELITEELKRS